MSGSADTSPSVVIDKLFRFALAYPVGDGSTAIFQSMPTISRRRQRGRSVMRQIFCLW